MACSKDFIERSESSLSNKKEYVEIKAVIGCFLIDDEQRVYALVNRHVTRALSGTVNIVNKNGEYPFGCCVSKKRSCFEQITGKDIDLIQVADNMKMRCRPVYRTSSGKTASTCKLYDGKIKDLYDKAVFMCTNDEERNACVPSRMKTSAIGTVRQLPPDFRKCFCEDNNFMVYGYSDESFADPGDSGRMIAIDVEQYGIELVGIVTHGEYIKGKSTLAVVEDVLLKQKIVENLNPAKDNFRKTNVSEETKDVHEVAVTSSVTTSRSENEISLAQDRRTLNEAKVSGVRNGAICLLLKKAICLLKKKYNLTLSVLDVHVESTSGEEAVETGRVYTLRSYTT